MKSVTLVAAAVGMLQLVSAQPHRRRNVHQHQHAKKDGDVVVTVVDTVYAEATEVPEVVVYVDGAGVPVSTATHMVNVPQAAIWSTARGAAPSPIASPTTPVVVVAPTPTPVAESPVVNVQVASSSAAPVYTSSAAPAHTSTPSSGGESSGFGVSYSPYNADGTCKSQSQVNTDFESLAGFSMVRTYGTDCNQVANVLSAAKAKGMKVFAGVYDISKLSSEIAAIVSAVKGDWSSINTISIGNELVNSGTASASAVVAAIGTARGLLKAAGYSGNVVTVDTLVAARANPSLCDASDFCAVNCHPFFDGGVTASQSGEFLQTQIPTLQAVLANKNQEVVITETGWPWKGQTNQKAVPSLSEQASAISSIKGAFAHKPEAVILFTAFNDLWKSNTPAQFEAEQFWGMGGHFAPSE